MLTDSEREWLKQRGKPEGYDGCDFEPEDLYDDIQDIYLEVVFNWPLKGNKKRLERVRRQENFAEASAFRVIEALRDFKDATLFEARVAAQLAAWETLPVPCMNDTYCDRSSLVCPSCRLKWARLAVEEEMDANR